MAYNTYNCHSWYNYHCQDHRRIPTSKQVHNRRTWIQCQSQQMLRTGVEPEHTRQCPATQRRLHCRCPAAESLRNPCDGWHETFSQEMDCSKPSEHHCTWCAPAPNNCTEQKWPLRLADSCNSNVARRAVTWTIMRIIRIRRIIEKTGNINDS